MKNVRGCGAGGKVGVSQEILSKPPALHLLGPFPTGEIFLSLRLNYPDEGHALASCLKHPVFPPPCDKTQLSWHLRLLAVEEGVFGHPHEGTFGDFEYQLYRTVPAAMALQKALQLRCVIDWHLSPSVRR